MRSTKPEVKHLSTTIIVAPNGYGEQGSNGQGEYPVTANRKFETDQSKWTAQRAALHHCGLHCWSRGDR